VASGTASLEILGPDSDSIESIFQVGTPADAIPADRAKLGSQHRIHHHGLPRARRTTLNGNQP
jgi:hypothetical protein